MMEMSPGPLATVELWERAKLDRRARRFRGDRPCAALADRTAVIVDDGIATGSTARPDGNLWFTEFGANHIGRLDLTPRPNVALAKAASTFNPHAVARLPPIPVIPDIGQTER